jgi:carotenoid cleavage dioxygenase-like enzyme
MKPLVYLSVFDKSKKMTDSIQIPISSPRFLHDFLITQNYAIIPDLPLESRPD